MAFKIAINSFLHYFLNVLMYHRYISNKRDKHIHMRMNISQRFLFRSSHTHIYIYEFLYIYLIAQMPIHNHWSHAVLPRQSSGRERKTLEKLKKKSKNTVKRMLGLCTIPSMCMCAQTTLAHYCDHQYASVRWYMHSAADLRPPPKYKCSDRQQKS